MSVLVPDPPPNSKPFSLGCGDPVGTSAACSAAPTTLVFTAPGAHTQSQFLPGGLSRNCGISGTWVPASHPNLTELLVCMGLLLRSWTFTGDQGGPKCHELEAGDR